MPQRRRHLQWSFALAIFGGMVSVAILVWDIYVLHFDSPDNTVSALLQAWSRQYLVIPLLTGGLIVHLFLCPGGGHTYTERQDREVTGKPPSGRVDSGAR